MIQPSKLIAVRHRYRFDFCKRFERLIKEQGIVCSYHDLRRTFASLKVLAGVSLFKVSSWWTSDERMRRKLRAFD